MKCTDHTYYWMMGGKDTSVTIPMKKLSEIDCRQSKWRIDGCSGQRCQEQHTNKCMNDLEKKRNVA